SVASEIRQAMVKHLWIESEQRFARGLLLEGENLTLDATIDASAFATFYFGTFSPTSAMVEGTMRAIRERLWVQAEAGGIARYEGDSYHRISEETHRVPGNPWILCTLWLAEYAIARARSVAELQSALDLVRWAHSKASKSQLLPEQVNPYDSQPLSVAPLTWSHAQLVSVLRGYLDSLRRLRATTDDFNARNTAKNQRANPVDNPDFFS
ncbi:MAG: glycoside hydrolase family 15 protein, partial [Thermoanaerobaculia bacterium]